MRKIDLIMVIAALWFTSSSCNNNKNIRLNKSYVFVHDGYDNNQIIGDHSIPENVIACVYDSNFIIAKQIPTKYGNAIYENEPIYRDGRDWVYFWLIVHRTNTLLGPFRKVEFDSVRAIYKVPANSGLKKIIIDSTDFN